LSPCSNYELLLTELRKDSPRAGVLNLVNFLTVGIGLSPLNKLLLAENEFLLVVVLGVVVEEWRRSPFGAFVLRFSKTFGFSILSKTSPTSLGRGRQIFLSTKTSAFIVSAVSF
jgi:hypothetical protein